MIKWFRMILWIGIKSNNLQFRSSCPELFCKKDVLRSLTKFTGKRLCQSLFFNKVACLRPATLLKKRLWHRCFPVNFEKSLRTPFYTEHLWWLLLTIAVREIYYATLKYNTYIFFGPPLPKTKKKNYTFWTKLYNNLSLENFIKMLLSDVYL